MFQDIFNKKIFASFSVALALFVVHNKTPWRLLDLSVLAFSLSLITKKSNFWHYGRVIFCIFQTDPSFVKSSNSRPERFSGMDGDMEGVLLR